MTDTPAPPPAALLIVRAGAGFALFDAAEAADTHPNDLPAALALSVHSNAASIAEAIEDWHSAVTTVERAARESTP